MVLRFIRVLPIRIFDALQQRFERVAARKLVGSGLIAAFLGALALIEIGRHTRALPWLPESHYYAIDVAFSLLLLFEVLELVFGLARSVSNALGKQLEILSLILLRSSFQQLTALPEPLEWKAPAIEPVLRIVSQATGAMLIFVVLGFYYRVQQHRRITSVETEQKQFVRAKKHIALALLVVFVGVGVYATAGALLGRSGIGFFATFYTVLIFADVLIVLVSIRYGSEFALVFRNSAFAVTTILIRIALSAPPYLDVALGLFAAVFALGLSIAYNAFSKAIQQVDTEERDQTSTPTS